MAEITGRGMRLIDRLFHFKAGADSAPEQFSTESPIQPVYDVRRVVEVSSGYSNSLVWPGFWWIGPTHTHPGVDNQQSSTNPRAVIRVANPELPDADLEWDVWWLEAFIFSPTESSINFANLNVLYPAGVPGQVLSKAELLRVWTTRVSIGDGAAAFQDASYGVAVTPPKGPLLLPIGSLLRAWTLSAAPTDITIVSRCWAGPRGALPPGMA